MLVAKVEVAVMRDSVLVVVTQSKEEGDGGDGEGGDCRVELVVAATAKAQAKAEVRTPERAERGGPSEHESLKADSTTPKVWERW